MCSTLSNLMSMLFWLAVGQRDKERPPFLSFSYWFQLLVSSVCTVSLSSFQLSHSSLCIFCVDWNNCCISGIMASSRTAWEISMVKRLLKIWNVSRRASDQVLEAKWNVLCSSNNTCAGIREGWGIGQISITRQAAWSMFILWGSLHIY